MEDHINQLKEEEKKQQEAADTPSASVTRHRAHHPTSRRGGNTGVGLALILIGGIFLTVELTSFQLNNWWALFILIPAFSNFRQALNSFQRNGRLTRHSASAVTWGFILLTVAAAFLFSVDWGLIWPVFLIIGGLGALLGGRAD